MATASSSVGVGRIRGSDTASGTRSGYALLATARHSPGDVSTTTVSATLSCQVWRSSSHSIHNYPIASTTRETVNPNNCRPNARPKPIGAPVWFRTTRTPVIRRPQV